MGTLFISYFSTSFEFSNLKVTACIHNVLHFSLHFILLKTSNSHWRALKAKKYLTKTTGKKLYTIEICIAAAKPVNQAVYLENIILREHQTNS